MFEIRIYPEGRRIKESKVQGPDYLRMPGCGIVVCMHARMYAEKETLAENKVGRWYAGASASIRGFRGRRSGEERERNRKRNLGHFFFSFFIHSPSLFILPRRLKFPFHTDFPLLFRRLYGFCISWGSRSSQPVCVCMCVCK